MHLKNVTLALFCVCLLSSQYPCQHPRELEDASLNRLKLVAELGAFRPIEGRLAGLAYSPQIASRPARDTSGLRLAARQIQRSFGMRRSSTSLADEGVLLLVTGHPEEALRLLEEAAHIPPFSAALQSDLAAVYLMQAQLHREPYYCLLALAAAEQACHSEPALAAARFNRALALEGLFLESAAHKAWQSYLVLDDTSGWATEARRHQAPQNFAEPTQTWDRARTLLVDAAQRRDLRTVIEIVTRFSQEAREYGEEELLAELAGAFRAKSALAAERTRALCRQIGTTLASRKGGDTMLAGALTAIDAAGARPAARRRSRLLEGQLHYRRGLSLYNRGDFGSAITELAFARSLLATGNSPFAGWASYQIARCDYQRFAYDRALAVLAGLVRSEKDRQHPALCGRAQWLVGLIHLIQGDPATALQAFSRALVQFSLMGETRNLARVHALAGTTLDTLGDAPAAWRHLHEALGLARRDGDPLTMFSAYTEAATAAARFGDSHVGLHFQNEVVRVGRSTADPLTIDQALQGRASLAMTEGLSSLASRDVFEAWRITEQLTNVPARRSLQGDLLLV